MRLSAVIPVRFLTIIFHLVLLIMLLQARELNVKAGLPLDHSEVEYKQRDMLFLGGLVAGITLTAFEMVSFFAGISMFASFPSIISIVCHVGAAVSLGHLVLDELDSQYYWLIFTFSSVLPFLIEVGVLVSVVFYQKGL